MKSEMKSDIHKIKSHILPLLKVFASVPSLTGHEEGMISKVGEYFLPIYPHYDFYVLTRKNKPYCAFLASDITPSKYVLVVHLDRVPNGDREPYHTLPVDHGEYIQGQLDDTIGIAIAHYLMRHSEKSISVLFTTSEEIGQSWYQIKTYTKLFSSPEQIVIPVGIDIDIFDTLPEQNGLISLRAEDQAGKMNLPEVNKFRTRASELSLPWTATEGYSITEIGFVSSHTREAIQGVHVGLPLTSYHTDKECIQWKAIENVIRLLTHIIKTS
jgi:hypothetical protein